MIRTVDSPRWAMNSMHASTFIGAVSPSSYPGMLLQSHHLTSGAEASCQQYGIRAMQCCSAYAETAATIWQTRHQAPHVRHSFAGVVCSCLLLMQEACSFNGAWRGKPSSMARVYYVSSYFWDRAQDSGIIADKDAIEWKTSPGVSAS